MFLKEGFTHLDRLISMEDVQSLRLVYDALLNDKKRTLGLRSDLAGAGRESDSVERITQIMRPSIIEPELLYNKAFILALAYAKDLLGDDMELDFDMLINKAPFTNTPTPWHQDAAYWIKLPDKRAVSCWIALDRVYQENGCMWFVPKTDDLVKPHKSLPNGGALYCDAPSEGAIPIPLAAGGCTFHDGFTLHFSQGNTTSDQRRALILNFRPKKMIALERQQGVDHTGTRKVRQK
ncbi:phytanoyl-CoA dioxygenase family protein [Arenibacter sp. GZD96]|uniref:phytanoyl-CoA dioxygenase family protein n=1 Tax=Aurantibrevibacter litoralis TaxID=3106030 RepID=UPI002AFEC15E|nr:phytanoyl-CoA dioxygenase family protein [Arenibacter sp. GZD-96]MEA1784830.1 phytanoyl-CoA dioxygenase family protein [Arenibacter sp. GZD-96]